MGGKVVLSEGEFNVATAPAISDPDISLEGQGLSTILVPAGDGLSLVGADRCNIGNLAIIGGNTGLDIVGAKDGIFHDIYLNGQAVDGLAVDGDAATEIHFRDVTMRDVAGIGFSYVRTDVADTGGLYLARVRIVESTGTLGFSFASSAGGTTPAYIFMSQCVADGYPENAILIDNVAQLRCDQGFFSVANASVGAAVTIDAGGAHAFVNTYMRGGAAAGFALSLEGSCNNLLLNNIFLDGFACTYAINATSGIAGVKLGQYILTLANLTNSLPFLSNQAGLDIQLPTAIVTAGGGGVPEAMAIIDSDVGGGAPKYIRNNNGTLQFLNAAFSAAILELSDTGILFPRNMKHVGPDLGFYDHDTTTQQVLATGGGATVDNVITALQALGLVKQS